MKITSKPGVGNKVHIHLDGKYAFTLYDDYWYRLGLAEGCEISGEELASLQEEAGFRSAYEKGLKLLSARAYSRKELTEKLKLKFGQNAAERAAQKLASYGYIDDEAFCEEYVHYLFEVKKFDTRRIEQELRQKGIGGETVSKTLKTLDNEPIRRIIEMLGTKYERYLDNEKDIRRLVARFMRMGYSYRDIKEAFTQSGVDMPDHGGNL